jgi:dTDP-L-rhamnose 4-epimerase
VAAIFASRLLNGRPPVVFEDGDQSRDFVHVTDIAAGIEAALEPGKGDHRAINLGTGVSTSVLRVAEVLARELGVEVEPELRQEYRAGDIRHCFGDISLARQELGYEPRVAFDDGMSELAGWLAGQEAEDRVEEATAALVERGLAG